MANLHSSKKRIKTNIKSQHRNTAVKTAIKTAIKKVETAIDEGELEAAQASYAEAVSALDSAVARNIIKKNNAARTKSRLAKGINAISAAA